MSSSIPAHSGELVDSDTLRGIHRSLEPCTAESGREGSLLDFSEGTEGFSKAMSALRFNAETGLLASVQSMRGQRGSTGQA